MRRLSRPILALALAIGCSTPALSPAPRAPLPTRASPEQEARAALLLTGPEWYRHAVFYEVYVRSFADANGDGIGDLAGLTAKLDYLKALGVDAIWLMPIMPTAFKDSGYDVSDYRSVNPEYGDLAAFDALVAAAHARKMRVMIDLVLNHTASNHAWFQESRSSKTNPKADWYVWSDTPSRADIGCGTAGPTFGDSTWTYEPARGQWYFHRFYPDQPDLNYRNPAVIAETLDTARSWLARGVDGFRCDVIGMLFERADGCDMVPETIDYIKRLRAVLDEFPERTMVSESSLANAAPYLGTGRDMFPMTFDFQYGYLWNLAFAAQNRQIVYKALEDALTTYPPGAQDARLHAGERPRVAPPARRGDLDVHEGDAVRLLRRRTRPASRRGRRRRHARLCAHAHAVDARGGARLLDVEQTVDPVRRSRGGDERRGGGRRQVLDAHVLPPAPRLPPRTRRLGHRRHEARPDRQRLHPRVRAQERARVLPRPRELRGGRRGRRRPVGRRRRDRRARVGRRRREDRCG
jgi:hypothetical protein